MKPDWDKLMDEYKDSETQLIADADCTADGKPICDSNGVKGFPTLKYGDPSDLQDYQGGRTYDAMKKFIDEELKPTCSPANLANRGYDLEYLQLERGRGQRQEVP